MDDLKKGKAVKQHSDILIADRNPNVREFLRREMSAAGYRVRLAVSGTQALEYASSHPVSLLIVDPDLPDADSIALLEKLRISVPSLPIVVHTFSADKFDSSDISAFIEKEAGSIEQLKQIVTEILSSDAGDAISESGEKL